MLAVSSAELLQREMKTMAGEMQDRVREQEQTVSTLQEEIGSLTRSLESEREAKRRLENELEKSRETCRRAKAEFVQSVAGAGRYFDFNSTFPSPSELTAEIDALSDGVFYDWLDIAFDTAKAWTPSHDLESVNYVVKQTLVLIVSQCHKTVQDVVNERMLLLKSFLACDPAIGRNQETPNYIRNLPANIFREAHKFIFRIFFPLPDGSFELLDDIIERVRTASELPDTEVLHYLLQSKSTSGVFRNLVLTLLQIFLECELSRPRPLRFDASFGGEEQWSSEKHSKRMIYPCEDGPGKFSSHDKVQVVLPPVYLAREDNETSRHRVNFETKAVVFSSATPNLTVNKGCHSGCTAVDTGEVRREMKSAMVDNIPPTIEPLTSRTS